MSLILNIETATDTCSVCVASDEKVLALAEDRTPRSHASVITLLIRDALSESGMQAEQLDAIAVSGGPGSYTGLRIGVAAAKGLCYGLGKPLVAVNTMQAMAAAMQLLLLAGRGNQPDCFVPLIDARRMEVYSSVIDRDFRVVTETRAEVLHEQSFLWLRERYNRVCFFGSGVEKLGIVSRVFGQHDFYHGFSASATGMTRFAYKAFCDQKTVDPAYYEPLYLKEFIGPAA